MGHLPNASYAPAYAYKMACVQSKANTLIYVFIIIIVIIIIGLYNTEDGNYTEKKLEDSVLMVWKL